MNTLDQNILHLKCSPLFENLSSKECSMLGENARYTTYQKGQNIRFKEESVGHLYFIVSGKVKLCEIDEDGNELIKEILKENDFFGELAPQSKSFHFEYVEAISSRVLVCKIPIAVIKDVMRSNPNFSFDITSEVWNRYKNIERRFRNVAYLKDVRTRLINFFKEWAVTEGERQGNSVTLKNYLTHKDIASLICSTRVTVTSILNELRTSGNIDYSKGQIVITDINKFKAA